MKTLYSLIAGVSMFALAGVAGAQEPIKLTDAQMDHVTAGAIIIYTGTATGVANAATMGNLFAISNTNTRADADPTGGLNVSGALIGVAAGLPAARGAASGATVSASGYVPAIGPTAAGTSNATATAALF